MEVVAQGGQAVPVASLPWQRRLELGRQQRDRLAAKMALEAPPDQGFRRMASADGLVDGPRMVDKRNHLTLVQAEYLYQIGLLPRQAWEAYSYLYSEAIQLGWPELLEYYQNLIRHSQSVDGFRSKQLVEAMAGDREKKSGTATQLEAGERAGTGLRRN